MSLTAPWWAYAAIVAAGLGLPVLLTLVPLLRTSPVTGWVVLVVLGAMPATEAAAGRASRITVREALSYV
ncbi:hypothetical protein E1262_28470 [Jiangella aurantiaca]|uniref:Uncharacterized protein n=1 Tax=Jiangella aurantiaca TaxID=2530373 RepID=A0A4R5A1I6_9ACTN|nr:hypothetical protein [Jiangella aurantiaca]TDD64359.1 hypothetical protein E1262_28470 [Jiangella aurantiaca]